jgi:hypothetical protein
VDESIDDDLPITTKVEWKLGGGDEPSRVQKGSAIAPEG